MIGMFLTKGRPKGHKLSQETKDKISASNKGVTRGVGRKISEETRALLRIAKSSPRKPLTEEHKSKLSAARKAYVARNRDQRSQSSIECAADDKAGDDDTETRRSS